MLSDIPAGISLGAAKSAKFMRSRKSRTPGIEIEFELSPSGERICWVGWLTDKALPYTMRTLVDVLGYNGSDAVTADGTGTLADPLAFDYGREVSLTIEIEEYYDESTLKKSPKIKWINAVNKSVGGLDSDAARDMLTMTGFRAAFLTAAKTAPPPPPPHRSTASDLDIPF